MSVSKAECSSQSRQYKGFQARSSRCAAKPVQARQTACIRARLRKSCANSITSTMISVGRVSAIESFFECDVGTDFLSERPRLLPVLVDIEEMSTKTAVHS